MLPRVPDWYDVVLGCIKLGAVPMPATTLLTPRDIAYRLNSAEASVVVVDAEATTKVDQVAADCPSLRTRVFLAGGGYGGIPDEASDQAGGWVSWADGLAAAGEGPPGGGADPSRTTRCCSTSPRARSPTPRWCCTPRPRPASATRSPPASGRTSSPTDLHWTVSDFGWAKAAWGKLFGQWALGAAIFLWDVRGKPDFELMLRLLGEHGITTFCAPPTVYRALVLLDLAGYDWSRLRHCVSAGEPLNPEVIKVWQEATGLTIYDGYGQTETVNLLANFRCLEVRPGSMGKPTPGFDVVVIDDDARVLGPGQEGHVAVRVRPERPVGMFTGYWRDPEATAAAFRGDFYDTGDRAYVDEDGYFWFVGRADDVITSAAYRIGPFEVESALVEHPAVAEAAVIGKPDPLRGQIVKAYVVLAPGHEGSDALVAELQEHCRTVTAPYKYPREIEFTVELPKTISGKIRRVELREREQATAAD